MPNGGRQIKKRDKHKSRTDVPLFSRLVTNVKTSPFVLEQIIRFGDFYLFTWILSHFVHNDIQIGLFHLMTVMTERKNKWLTYIF